MKTAFGCRNKYNWIHFCACQERKNQWFMMQCKINEVMKAIMIFAYFVQYSNGNIYSLYKDIIHDFPLGNILT